MHIPTTQLPSRRQARACVASSLARTAAVAAAVIQLSVLRGSAGRPGLVLGGEETSAEETEAHAGVRAGEADCAGTVTCPPEVWRSVLEYRGSEGNPTFALPSSSAWGQTEVPREESLFFF